MRSPARSEYREGSAPHRVTVVWQVIALRPEVPAMTRENAADPPVARPAALPRLWRATRERFFPSFAHPNFGRLWRANAGAMTAHFVQFLAQGWLVVELTNSPFTLGLLSFFMSLPMLVLSPVGGLLADRLSRPRLLMMAQSVNGLTAFTIGLLVATGAIAVWHLAISATLTGAMFALSVPARYALISEAVPRTLVRNAVALNATTMNLARVIGPALAGLIVGAAGIAAAYFTMVGGYVWSILNVRRIDADEHRPRAQGSPVAILRAGFVYVLSHGPIRSLMVLTLAPALFSYPLTMLLPAFVKQDLQAGVQDLGLVTSALGAGAVLGALALVAAPEVRRPGRLAIAAIVINGALYVILSFTRFLPFVALVLACVGMFQGIHMALSQTIVQLLVPAHMRGRVMAVWMINWGLMPLGLLPLSATAERLGTPVAMAIGGSLSLCVGVFVALWGRQLWGLTAAGLHAAEEPAAVARD